MFDLRPRRLNRYRHGFTRADGIQFSRGKRLLDWRLPPRARREHLDQQFQVAFIDNGDGVFRAMSANVAFNLVGVSRLSYPDLPIVIHLMAAKNW
jgi:hypothetical protein